MDATPYAALQAIGRDFPLRADRPRADQDGPGAVCYCARNDQHGG